MNLDQLEKILTGITAVTAEVNPAVAGIAGVVQLVYAGWKKFKAANPGATEQDYITLLEQKGGQVAAIAAGWLMAKGYTQDAAGNWQAPPEPATPPVV